MAATPDISVVIATHRRETRLAFALEALAAQTLPHERFEVVVVRSRGPKQGSLTTTPAGPDIRWLESERASAAAQRDLGWRAARGPLVAFTDDDCRPAATWLDELLAMAGASGGRSAIIQGRTEPDPDEAHLLFASTASVEITGPTEWYETCNIAYPRELLERVDGFDPEFLVGGEDTDLGLRARAAGAVLVYADDALVLHAVHNRGVIRAITSPPLPSSALVLARHPEQRNALFLRIFWSRGHALLLLGLLVMLLAKGRRRGLLGLTPYIATELHHALNGPPLSPLGAARLLMELAERLAIDLGELAANARRSARYGALLL